MSLIECFAVSNEQTMTAQRTMFNELYGFVFVFPVIVKSVAKYCWIMCMRVMKMTGGSTPNESLKYREL